MIVRRFVDEVLNNDDDSAMSDLVHRDYRHLTPDGELRGRDGLKALFDDYRGGLPDLNVVIDDLVVSGDKVVTSIRLTGTHSSDLLGIPATGKLLRVHGMVLSRLEDGKIIEEWEILDLLGMFRQLGVVSLPER
ncbi:ester cyclase [Wenzhouxiangella sediminis]|uniref:Ester cyclase n=2 Tax=Wenzhouxiangella sediminis TaxID=1792836 RepID=A0A3E1K9Y1_9GAMM|nr:ester cyclase [Wenzhouxiangella sediminis]